MRACQNCRYADRATDQAGATYYLCRLAPPKPVVISGQTGQEVAWAVPPMRPLGWCGEFRLAFFRWLANFGRRGT